MKREFKANKLDILKSIRTREIVNTMDLINEFDYTYRGDGPDFSGWRGESSWRSWVSVLGHVV